MRPKDRAKVMIKEQLMFLNMVQNKTMEECEDGRDAIAEKHIRQAEIDILKSAASNVLGQSNGHPNFSSIALMIVSMTHKIKLEGEHLNGDKQTELGTK